MTSGVVPSGAPSGSAAPASAAVMGQGALTAAERRRASSWTLPFAAPWWLGVIVLLTVIGFQRAATRTTNPMDWQHASHGILALGWSVILVVQAWLAEQRRRDAHRLMAVVGVVFAIGLVATSLPMLASLAAGATANAGFRPMGLRLLAMDIMLLALFVLLFAVAVAFVRRPAVHARALAATGLLALPAGLGRVYMRVFAVDPMQGSYLALGTAVAVLGVLALIDRRAGTRDVVQPLVLVALLLVGVLTGVVADAPWFGTMAARIAGV